MMSSLPVSCPEWHDQTRTSEEKLVFMRLYKRVIEVDSSKSVTPSAVTEWHGIAFKPCVPVPYYAGNTRQDDASRPCLMQNVAVRVWSGSVPITLMQGLHFQKVPSNLRSVLEEGTKKISDYQKAYPKMNPDQKVRTLALITAQTVGRFNTIHPFLNGNGRMGRLILKAYCARFGIHTRMPSYARPTPNDVYCQAMSDASKGNPAALAALLIASMYEASTKSK